MISEPGIRIRIIGKVGMLAAAFVIKPTKDGEETFLVNFHFANAGSIRRMLAKEHKISGDGVAFLTWLEQRAR
jgi:hypothetical protein